MSTLQQIKDGIYSSVKQEALYSIEPHTKGSWPTATWLSSALDSSFINLLKKLFGIDGINLDDRLESDLGLDEIDLLDFHIKVYDYFKIGRERICPFVTWGDMSFHLSKEKKVPYFDYSVAELIDMIVRSGIIKKPLSKKTKEHLLQYDFSGIRRAKNSGDKFKMRISVTPLEPGAYFITDPFVVDSERHDTVDDVMNLFHYEEHRKSDALFAEVVKKESNYSVNYINRTAILNSTLSYAKKVKVVQDNYRCMLDGNGYYRIETTDESMALKIAEEFRRILIDELNFVDLC